MIKRGEVGEIKEIMEKSENLGMQTFDMALYNLYKDGKISLEEALKNADAENNLRLKIELAEKGNRSADADSDSEKHGGLSLIADEEEEEVIEGPATFALPSEA
jgi:twitching motility protein PilU